MSGYKSNITFAIRSILIYNSQKNYFKEYEYTFLSGTILNVLSGIYPDTKLLVSDDILDALIKKLPKFVEATRNNPEKKHIETYFTKIRDALSKKLETNFSYTKEEVSYDILEIRLKTENLTEKLIFNFSDLQSLFSVLEWALKSDPEYKSDYEKEGLEFSKKTIRIGINALGGNQ
jgi:hypothetical protein